MVVSPMNKPDLGYAADFFILVFTVGLLAGCQTWKTMQNRESMDRFERATKVYGSALRWGHFNTAVGYLRSRDGTPLEPTGEFDRDQRAVAYEIQTSTILNEGDEVLLEAKNDYFSANTGMVKTIIDRQHWWRDAEGGHWFLEGEIPEVFIKPGDGGRSN